MTQLISNVLMQPNLERTTMTMTDAVVERPEQSEREKLDIISAELKFILSQCEIMRQLGEDEEKFMYHYTINRFSNRIDGAVYLIQSLLGVQSESD